MIVCGIDADFEKSGVCVIDTKQKTVKTFALSFFDMLKTLENAKNQNVTFALEGAFLNKGLHHTAQNIKIGFKIGVAVGKNHAICEKIRDFMDLCKLQYTLIRPLKKTWKNGKISTDELINELNKFNYKLTENHNNLQNQDIRDACLIALHYIKNCNKQLNLF